MRKNWTPLSRFPTPFRTFDPDPFSFLPSLGALGASLATRPHIWSRKLLSLGRVQLKGLQRIWLSAGEDAKMQAQLLLKHDRRFQGDAWSDSRVHSSLALLYSNWRSTMLEMVDTAPDLDEQSRLKAKFFIEQCIEMSAPSNWFLLNPEALREAQKTKGMSLLNGFSRWMQDLQKGTNMPSQSEPGAFVIGENIANTPGTVVAKNHLCEIIQYEPTTEKVQETPILLIPPWINKYYILDLGEKKSYIRHLVDSGFTVFVVSWKNPGAEMRDTKFDDYVLDGARFAKDCVTSITQQLPGAIGYCIGGTLLATAQAYFKAKGIPPFTSLTFFNTMVDFCDVGDIKVFIDERSIRHIEQNMENRGFLKGAEMGSSFNYLRSKDLLWRFYVDSYLMGKTPAAFDMLAWNEDATRMPAAMHGWYLRNMYLNNLLRVPGALHIDNTPIDLGRIQEDIYSVASEKDHIALASTVYCIHSYTRSSIQFIVASGGHIAGIINPPSRGKGYYYRADPIQTPFHDSFDVWMGSADKKEGSWWTHHQRWLSDRTGSKIAPPRTGSVDFPPLGAAPGLYVSEK